MLTRRNFVKTAAALAALPLLSKVPKARAVTPQLSTNLKKDAIFRTGFPTLDACLGDGLQAGSLFVVLGTPGTGKTSFIQQIKHNQPDANWVESGTEGDIGDDLLCMWDNPRRTGYMYSDFDLRNCPEYPDFRNQLRSFREYAVKHSCVTCVSRTVNRKGFSSNDATVEDYVSGLEYADLVVRLEISCEPIYCSSKFHDSTLSPAGCSASHTNVTIIKNREGPLASFPVRFNSFHGVYECDPLTGNPV